MQWDIHKKLRIHIQCSCCRQAISVFHWWVDFCFPDKIVLFLSTLKFRIISFPIILWVMILHLSLNSVVWFTYNIAHGYSSYSFEIGNKIGAILCVISKWFLIDLQQLIIDVFTPWTSGMMSQKNKDNSFMVDNNNVTR